ncbi:hypothetical protein C1646_760014, partial [Rhizophagus diaphanus]
MEWYHFWRKDYERGETPIVFKKFWDILFKFEPMILTYNDVTLKGLLGLPSMDNREREDTIHKGKCRDIVDRIIESIKYKQQPTMREKEDWDVENRFQKFWEWYDTILEMGMKVDRIRDEDLAEVMTRFRKLLYMEEKIAEDEKETDNMIWMITNLIEYREVPEERPRVDSITAVWDRYIQKIRQRFIDTRQFTKEPEDSEKEDGIEWSVELLKEKIEEMGGKLADEDIQRIWNLRIRMELVLTEDFLGAFFERKNLSDEKLKDEMKDWLEQETIECNDCGNRKLPYMIRSSTGQCENCEHKELLELKDDLEKL